METQELHRGRLTDHIQLVVRDLFASQTFYTAIFDVLNIPMGGTGDGFFWADELVVSTSDSEAAQGILTGLGLVILADATALSPVFKQATGSF
jgi:hypothetical protein